MMKLGRIGLVAVLGLMLAASSATMAGPVIIDGTDSNEHGFASGGTNFDGWEYMQRVLENLGPNVTAGTPAAAKVVRVLGSISSTAASSIASAFSLSALPGAGWSITTSADIAGTLASLDTSTTGILYISTSNLTSGDLSSAQIGLVNAGASSIASFVASGGGLFAQGESGTGAFGWLSTLIPGLVTTDLGGGGEGSNITLTPAGVAAFPGLTNADLAGADPWHVYFSGNLGSLSVLGTAPQGGLTRNVIIGGGTGTVIADLPEPGTIAGLGLGIVFLAGYAARRRRSA